MMKKIVPFILLLIASILTISCDDSSEEIIPIENQEVDCSGCGGSDRHNMIQMIEEGGG